MWSITSPASFRIRQIADTTLAVFSERRDVFSQPSTAQLPLILAASNTTLALLQDGGDGGASHPDFLHLAGLVCEAVLEVVFVALPGYLVAVTGMFDANSQKFVAELNTMVFTPCLVFTKLASQLNADKLADLVVIPFIFTALTLVSWLSGQLMAWLFGFSKKGKKMQKNFILAMSVFGNSNSLPISLVISLSKTISGLHWDQVPGDNDDEVAARGILYLLIFQQLGQLLRWTWGYSVLLKPATEYEEEERAEGAEEHRGIEEGRYRDEPEEEEDAEHGRVTKPSNGDDSGFSSGSQTPDGSPAHHNSRRSNDTAVAPEVIPATPANGNKVGNEPRHLAHRTPSSMLGNRARSLGHITIFPNYQIVSSHRSRAGSSADEEGEGARGWKAPLYRIRTAYVRTSKRFSLTTATFFSNLFRRLPTPIQKFLSTIGRYISAFLAGVWRQMNPPLWAMLTALIVASIPALQDLFFTPGTLISNSVTRAISQSGSVAVPLILVVLGANLARSTLPQDQLANTPGEKREERKLLAAALLGRMLIPTIIMAPILALVARFVPVSILDDPIFIIVCFLLTGAPSALQLAQICQINNVFMGAMSNLLVCSYVVAIFPSTLMLVLMALEVVAWAVANNGV